jgi:predicted acyltransferase
MQTERVRSIDVLRGLTVLLMLFVNDMPGVEDAPVWLKHIQPPTADGMTLPDFVFPAFLFIVGLSSPFGIESRRGRGESWIAIWRHVLTRTASLLVIGVFMVNSPASQGGWLDPNLWWLLAYTGVILVWNDWRGTGTSRRWLRAAGAGILLAAAILFRGPGEAPGFIELTTQWWGILGLIGWSYLVGCLVYTFAHRESAAMIGSVALLYCVCLAGWAGLFEGVWLNRWVGIGSALGSNGALTVSGAVLGRMLLPGSRLETHRQRLVWATLYAAGLALAAMLLHALHDVHQVFIYNKIMATPPAALLTAALTIWIWVVVYALVDVRSWRHVACWVEPAGRNALFIFVLGPILYHLMWWSPTILGGFEPHSWLGSPFGVGLARSIGFTVLVVWLAEALRRVGLRLRL